MMPTPKTSTAAGRVGPQGGNLGGVHAAKNRSTSDLSAGHPADLLDLIPAEQTPQTGPSNEPHPCAHEDPPQDP